MGSTATALRTQTGVTYCYVLAIEGYSWLLTDWSDTTAVTTAWAATAWIWCLPGLKVGGPFSQRIKPWQSDLDVNTLQISVVPDEDDRFGKAVFTAKGTYNTRLTDTFQPDATGAGTIDVKSTAGFDATGSVYIGGQKHDYSSKTGTTFTVGAAGSNAHSPFTAGSGNNYSPPASNPAGVNGDVAAPVVAANVPLKWIGRKCALYIHRVVDGVLDVKAQAQLEFAGVIRDISDSETGETVLELEDIKAKIRDAVILDRQWTGYVKHGINLRAGTQFFASELDTLDESGRLTVVASGASGTDEINEGYYEVDVFLSKVNEWLANDGSLSHKWTFSIKTTSDVGTRLFITVTSSTIMAAGTGTFHFHFHCTNHYPLDFLGFTKLTEWNRPDDGSHWFYLEGVSTGVGYDREAASDRAPYRAKFLQNQNFALGSSRNVVIEFDTSDGTFFDQREYLPPGLLNYTETGSAWSIFQVGNAVYLARYDSATQISSLTKRMGVLADIDSKDDDEDALSFDADTDRLPVKQVLLLSGSFADIATKLIASISGGDNGVNHDDYDVFPWGAGIPWSLLGDNWVNSCRGLEESLNSKSITTLVTEPTRILDLLVPELVMRDARIVWKDEGLQLRTLPTPNATTADHTLDETNKAEPSGVSSAGRTTTNITNEFLRNIVKFEYARNAAGEYRRKLNVLDQSSITEFGGSAVKTIQAINSFGAEAQAGASVEEMAASLISRVFPKFAKPLWVVRRTVAPTLYHAVPGDTVVFSDDFARDPTTGARGVQNRAGVILSVSYDRGSEGGKLFGEVEILLGAEDRHYPMAPAAEVDATYNGALGGHTFVNGYDAATGALKLKTHAYSNSAAALDVTRFAATDLIRIVRLDDGTSGDAWSRTIGSLDTTNSILVPTSTLSSPAWTSATTERYRIQYREYSACTASQKLKAFQADDADGLIEDAAEPNTYGEQQWLDFDDATLTVLPILPNATEYWGDGKPFHPGLLNDAAVLHNSLANYRTAPNCPVMFNANASTNAVVYLPVMMFPMYLGPVASAGLVRKLKVAPFFKTNDASNTATVRVTSSDIPPKASPTGDVFEFQGATKSVTFTSTSTSFAEATEQSLTPVRGNGIGLLTWITVEFKASNASFLSTVLGLSRLYLGPAEVY